jgi:hypothetical protein
MDVCFTLEEGDNVIAWEVKPITLYWLHPYLDSGYACEV